MSRIESTNEGEPINDNIETLFYINEQHYRLLNKSYLLESLQSIEAKNEIIYNSKSIAHVNEH